MRDTVDHLEAGAEVEYYEMLQPDGRLKCGCGRIFNANEEGGIVSPNPYAMPICRNCFSRWKEQIVKHKSKKPVRADSPQVQLLP